MARNEILYRGQTYTRLSGGSCYLAMSLLCDSLETNTLNFILESDDKTLQEFKRNDPVVYSHDGRHVGTFYVQSVTRISARQYDFRCISMMGILTGRSHNGGIYTGKTVAELVDEICGDVPHVVKNIVGKVKVYGWLPIGNARNNLARLLFSVGAVVQTDLDGVIHINGLWDGISSVQKDICDSASVQKDSEYSAVSITEHQYIKDLTVEDTVLFDGTAVDGDVITFQEPVHSLVADGFTITEYGDNYAVLSAGTGKLLGKEYIHNTRTVTKPVNDGVEENIKTISEDSTTLVSLVNSNAVADRLARYYKCNKKLSAPVYCGAELPGSRVITVDPYDKTEETAVVSKMDISISGQLKAQTEMLYGFVPDQFEDAQYYDERVVLTGSGSWTPPAGVTEVTAVLIAPGKNGDPGTDGEAGGSNSLIVATNQAQKGGSWSRPAGKGGAGGVGGNGGEGGKVLRSTINVTGPVSYNAPTAVAGGETIFGDKSTVNGSASESGYTDPVTLETFAARGNKGIDGGAGGDGAEGINGNNGGDVPPNVGGAFTPGWRYSNGWDPNTDVYTGSMEVGSTAGGGAAVGNDGSAAVKNKGDEAVGGTGANANAPTRETVYGKGGIGGNGGGGGGAGGKIHYQTSGSQWAKGCWVVLDGGAAGKGSAGSAGGDGCIILYYRKVDKKQNGALRDKNGRLMIDRLRRQIVV